MITGVDANGSVTDASYLPNVGEPHVGHILITIPGVDYVVDDIIPVLEYTIISEGRGYGYGSRSSRFLRNPNSIYHM